jgi:hypothetical protein
MNVSALRQAGGSAFRQFVHDEDDTGWPKAAAQAASSADDVVEYETMGARAGSGPVGSSWPTHGSAVTFWSPEQYCGRTARRKGARGGAVA